MARRRPGLSPLTFRSSRRTSRSLSSSTRASREKPSLAPSMTARATSRTERTLPGASPASSAAVRHRAAAEPSGAAMSTGRPDASASAARLKSAGPTSSAASWRTTTQARSRYSFRNWSRSSDDLRIFALTCRPPSLSDEALCIEAPQLHGRVYGDKYAPHGPACLVTIFYDAAHLRFHRNPGRCAGRGR